MLPTTDSTSGLDEIELLEAVGTKGKTDATGSLSVFRENETLMIAASAHSSWAFVRADAMREEIVIDLAPDDVLRVQVVDANRRPESGVVVSFEIEGQGIPEQSRRSLTTEPDEVATLRGVAAFARTFRHAHERKWVVATVRPRADRISVPVDIDDVPTDTIVLRAPQVGPTAFTGKIVHADDSPLVNERITLRALATRSSARPFETPCVGEGTTDDEGAFSIEVPVAGVEPRSFDCELFVHSATGLEFTLNGVAVVGEKNGAARMGTLRLPDR